VTTLYCFKINGCGLRCAWTAQFFHIWSRTRPS